MIIKNHSPSDPYTVAINGAHITFNSINGKHITEYKDNNGPWFNKAHQNVMDAVYILEETIDVFIKEHTTKEQRTKQTQIIEARTKRRNLHTRLCR